MGWYDYLSDLASSISAQPSYADERVNAGPEDKSGEQNSGKDASSGGIGTAQQDRGAGTKGGVSSQLAHAGTNEESDSEKEANAADAEKASGRAGEGAAGHKPGDEDGKAKAGQVGADSAGPHGGPVGGSGGDGDDDEAEGGDEGGDDEEEEEEEEEPEDPKPKLEEGKSIPMLQSSRHRLKTWSALLHRLDGTARPLRYHSHLTMSTS